MPIFFFFLLFIFDKHQTKTIIQSQTNFFAQTSFVLSPVKCGISVNLTLKKYTTSSLEKKKRNYFPKNTMLIILFLNKLFHLFNKINVHNLFCRFTKHCLVKIGLKLIVCFFHQNEVASFSCFF